MGRGLLSRGGFGQAGKPGPMGMGGLGPQGQTPGFGGPMAGPQMPPQMGQMGQGMPGAFSGNPEFMAQLQQMMAMKPFAQPPRVGMPTQPGAQVGQGMPNLMGGGGFTGGMMGGFQMPQSQQPYMDNDMIGMGSFGGYGKV